MLTALKRFLAWLGVWGHRPPGAPRDPWLGVWGHRPPGAPRDPYAWKRPPGAPRDPYAWKPAPVRPRPGGRTSAVAVAEPDDD